MAPEAFGVLGIYVAILTVLTPVAALTYPTAIVLPKDDCEAKGLVKLSILLAIGISAITVEIIFVWGDALACIFGISNISQFLWLVPFSIIFGAFQQVSQQWLIRKKRFKLIAHISVFQSLIMNGSKAVIGVWYPLVVVLISIQTLSSALYVLLLSIFGLKSKRVNEDKYIINGCYKLIILAVKYKDFPLFRAPEVMISSVLQGAPVLILASLYGPATAGFYTLGRTVVGAPSNLIGKSVGDVFYPRISEAKNNGEELYPLVKKVVLALSVVGIFPFGFLILFSPSVFLFLFGSEWEVAGEYTGWLACWFFLIFINKPLLKVIPVIGLQHLQLIYTTICLCLISGALVISYYIFMEDVISIISVSIVGMLLNIMLILFVLMKCKEYDRKVS